MKDMHVNFFRSFVKKGLPQGVSFAMMMAAGMWLADQPLHWSGFFLWLFGFAIFVASVECFRTEKVCSGETAVMLSDKSQIVARYERTYKFVGLIFLACIIAPNFLYYFGYVDENSAWPFALGLAAATFLPLGYLKISFLKNGGCIQEFLLYGELKDGVSPKWQVVLFFVYAVASFVVTVIAGYQLYA